MTEAMETVIVNTAPPYPVRIGPGLLDRCGAFLRELLPPCRAAVVSDSTVAPLYLERAVQGLRAGGFRVSAHVIPAGETHKNLKVLSRLLEELAAARLTRSDCVVALGGGVTGDLAGFAAAVYLRGIPYVQLPTTLLAAVDSSVGGKTAVDLGAGKNLAGAFWQPAAVLCDTDCLKTLSPSVLADGAAEAIKTGVLAGEGLFSLLERGVCGTELPQVITCCVRCKAGVVERDPTERGERRLLNLGHTVGHAIEKCSGYTVPHGHAVAAGLAVIARAAERLGWAKDDGMAARIAAALQHWELPTGTRFPVNALVQAALADKKRSGDAVTLVIPEALGHCTLRPVPVAALGGILAAGLEE